MHWRAKVTSSNRFFCWTKNQNHKIKNTQFCRCLAIYELQKRLLSLQFNGARWSHFACGAQSAKKTQQQCPFLEIMTHLLKIIHKASCDQLHVETSFFLYHLAEGSMHLLRRRGYLTKLVKFTNVSKAACPVMCMRLSSMSRCTFYSAQWY